PLVIPSLLFFHYMRITNFFHLLFGVLFYMMQRYDFEYFFCGAIRSFDIKVIFLYTMFNFEKGGDSKLNMLTDLSILTG
ncbi:MAG: hypothetical protein DRP50_00785, partial [Thermotoga sp.]